MYTHIHTNIDTYMYVKQQINIPFPRQRFNWSPPVFSYS